GCGGGWRRASRTRGGGSGGRKEIWWGPAPVALLVGKKGGGARWSAAAFACVSLKIEAHPPAVPFSGLVAFVSPVSSKKNSRKEVPGRKTPFSGRLKGVPCAALASALESKGALPFTAVSWMVTQLVRTDTPYVCSASWSG